MNAKTPGRPPKQPSEKREPWLSLRANEKERKGIQQKAAQHKLPVSVYIRRIAYRGYTRNTDAVTTLILSTGRIEEAIRDLESLELTQIARTAQEIRVELSKLRYLATRV